MEEYVFKLTTKEAELLMNALQNQTTNLINKIQKQFSEQQEGEKDVSKEA